MNMYTFLYNSSTVVPFGNFVFFLEGEGVLFLFIPFSSSLAKLLFIALSLLFSVFLLCIFHSETVSRLIALIPILKGTPALFFFVFAAFIRF